MRHGKRNIKFGRHPAHRRATVYSLVRNLVQYKKIETTLTKAKEARRLADKLVTWGKKGTLHQRRLAFSVLGQRDLVSILFKDIAPLFTKRNGGYTRVIHTRIRVGDGAQLAILEWTEQKKEEAPKKAVKKEKEVEKKEKHEEPKEQKPAKKEVHEVKPEHKKEPEKAKPAAEKPKEEKPVKEEPKVEKKAKPGEKGFLGGLRKLFDKKGKQ